jgi:hypothetical protein
MDNTKNKHGLEAEVPLASTPTKYSSSIIHYSLFIIQCNYYENFSKDSTTSGSLTGRTQ